jgi:nucleoid DNA-binding protein
MARNKEEIIEDLANKYHLTIEEVEDIINHQFKFISTVMRKGGFDTIRLPYFGKFIVNKNRVKHINRLKNEKDIKDV